MNDPSLHFLNEDLLFKIIFRILTNIYERAFSGNSSFFHDGSPYRTETSPLICSGNQRTGFYMIGTSLMKELKASLISTSYLFKYSLTTKEL